VAGWSDDPRIALREVAAKVDADNTGWLVEVVTAQGWPQFSVVGEEAATDARLLAQHADMQPEQQRLFHELMAAAVEDGEAEAKYFAYLEDRVRVNSGRPQLYGTQFVDHGQGLEPQPSRTVTGCPHACSGRDGAVRGVRGNNA
jgi:hypothetical protein